jgi:segregation and condensation protein B
LPPTWKRIGARAAQQGTGGDLAQAERLSRLEAVLFLAKEPLSSRKIAILANLADGSEARTLIRQLQSRYESAGRAFQIEEVAGGFQMLTRPRYARWVRKYGPGKSALGFSGPALETLAIVAYRQPILRADVEAIRGVACDEILRQLMDRGLLRIVGRANELGRPILYGTTRRFLEVFGLKSLDDLPRARQLARLGDSRLAEGSEQVGQTQGGLVNE